MERKKPGRPDAERYFMSSVKIGPKGQIVIPKEAREMFGLAPGDSIVLLADRKRGIAIQRFEQMNPYLKHVFRAMEEDEAEEAEIE